MRILVSFFYFLLPSLALAFLPPPPSTSSPSSSSSCLAAARTPSEITRQGVIQQVMAVGALLPLLLPTKPSFAEDVDRTENCWAIAKGGLFDRYRHSVHSMMIDDQAGSSAFIFPNVSEPRFTSTCFMDLESDGKALGRIEISLYGDVTPKTVANFESLCRGDKGVSYEGTSFYRVLKDFTIQGGDIGSKKPGATGTSSFGEPFAKENFRIRHNLKGLVSMVNDKSQKVDSRFFIYTGKPEEAGWADDKFVGFGRVTKGMDVIEQIDKVSVKTPSNNPVKPIKIVKSGVL